MREIMFRARHRRCGEKVNMAGDKLPAIWAYGGVLQCKGERSIIYGSTSPNGEFEGKYPVSTDTLGQYTGLVDKNGRMIFEGDICTGKSIFHEYTEKFEVIWKNSGFCWAGLKSGNDYCFENCEDIEVINNIHDNPSFDR